MAEAEGKKIYDDVRFVRIEKLKGRAQEIAKGMGLISGLAILKMSIHSLPEYEIVPVKGDPLDAMNQLAMQDGITPEKLNSALKSAFDE